MKNEERLFLLKSYLGLTDSTSTPLLNQFEVETGWDDENYLDINKFRKLVWQSGLPENEKYRALVWKLLLSYLPLNLRSSWQSILKEQRQLYQNYIQEFIVNFKELTIDQSDKTQLSGSKPDKQEDIKSDHPLCANSQSDWNMYFKDKTTLQTIQLDINRTLTDFHFLRMDEDIENFTKNQHNIAMQRILFLFVKLNSGIGYVQGMNDLVATLYYVNLQSQFELNWSIDIEADTFHMFNLLIQGSLRDLYNKTLDWDHSSGMGSILKNFSDRLAFADPLLAQNLKDKSIEPSYYVFRYLSTLGSREFSLPDLVEIWDFLLAYGTREQAELVDTMVLVSVSMVVLQKNQLILEDFNENVKLLQAYPYPYPTHQVVELAVHLDRKFFNGEIASPNSSPSFKQVNSETDNSRDREVNVDSNAIQANLTKKVNHLVGRAGSQLRNLASNINKNPTILDKMENKLNLNWSNKSFKDWINNRHNPAQNNVEKELETVSKY